MAADDLTTASDPSLDPFGPFDPPGDEAIEPELLGESPRPIPPELYEGRYASGQRRAFWGLLTTGALAIASGELPIVQTWGLYVLPLGYLKWIGLGCVVLGLGMRIANRLRKGPFRYVEEGIPLLVRIRELALQVKVVVNGQPSVCHFVAVIDYRNPISGHLVQATTSSNDFSSDSKDRLTTSYRIGDYATAVYLRGNRAETLRLYGFLDLRPHLGLVRRDGAPEAGPLKTLLLIACVFGFMGILFWNIFALGRYAPLEQSLAQQGLPFAIGAVVLGGALLGSLLYAEILNRKRRRQRNEEALASGEAMEMDPGVQGWFGSHGIVLGVICLAGSLLMGGLTMLCWCYTANAWLDDSPTTIRPVRIENLWTTTHSFLFREYTIEYSFLGGDGSKHKLLSTPDEMDQFRAPFGSAQVRAGRFGWPWVQSIAPAGMKGVEAPAEAP